MPLKAVLFDMDGVIVDTMKLHAQASRKVFGELGLELSASKGAVEKANRTFDAFRRSLPHKTDEEIRALESKKYDYLKEMSIGIGAFPGFADFFLAVKAKYKIALVSNSRRHYIDFIMARINMLGEFPVIVSADDILLGKPAPDCYLRAAQILKVKPHECAVIEDSLAGITSAKNAGMKVVAVETTHERNFLLDADIVVPSLENISLEKIEALFDA